MLIGCGIPDPEYWDFLVAATVQAARDATRKLRPARLRYATAQIKGHHYNRRQALEDKPAVQSADQPVKKMPTWDQMLFVRVEDESGRGIAGMVHWATHALHGLYHPYHRRFSR